MLWSGVAESVSALAMRVDSTAIPWKRIVTALLWAVYAFDTYVSLRQYRMYDLRTPPSALAPHVPFDAFRKSQAYGRDKMRFQLVSDAISQVVSALVVHYNLYAWAWGLAGALLARLGVAEGEIVHSLAWMVVMTALRTPLSLALSGYRNFVIEERHGFNKLTPTTFVTDTLKEWALGILVLLPLTAAMLALIRWAGDAFVVYTVAFFAAAVLLGSVVYPTLIQPLFNKLTPLPEGALRDRVVALAGALRFPLKHLYVIDGSRRSSHSNAYFYGVVPGGSKHIVIYDTLIDKSTPEEIEAVLAHELGHWSYSHPTKLLFVSLAHMFFTLALFTFFIKNGSLYAAFGFRAAKQPGWPQWNVVTAPYLPVLVGLDLYQLVLNPTDTMVQFAVNAALRHMEYSADRFAGTLARPPRTPAEKEALALAQRGVHTAGDATVRSWLERADLSGEPMEPYTALLNRALVKLHVQNLSSMHHDPLYSAMHYSHPTLNERLVALARIATGRKAE